MSEGGAYAVSLLKLIAIYRIYKFKSKLGRRCICSNSDNPSVEPQDPISRAPHTNLSPPISRYSSTPSKYPKHLSSHPSSTGK
jgi:hypothetical protein